MEKDLIKFLLHTIHKSTPNECKNPNMKEELQNIPQSIKYKGKSANIYQNKIKKQTLL